MPDSQAYTTCARLTHQLHDMIRRGLGDSDETELVRDALDIPWAAMTGPERRRIGELSARLNEELVQREPALNAAFSDLAVLAGKFSLSEASVALDKAEAGGIDIRAGRRALSALAAIRATLMDTGHWPVPEMRPGPPWPLQDLRNDLDRAAQILFGEANVEDFDENLRLQLARSLRKTQHLIEGG